MTWSSEPSLFRAEPMVPDRPMVSSSPVPRSGVSALGFGGAAEADAAVRWADIANGMRPGAGSIPSSATVPMVSPAFVPADLSGSRLASGTGVANPIDGYDAVSGSSPGAPSAQPGIGSAAGDGADLAAASEELRRLLESGAYDNPEVLSGLHQALSSLGPEFAHLAEVVENRMRLVEERRLATELFNRGFEAVSMRATMGIITQPDSPLNPASLIKLARKMFRDNDNDQDT